MIGVIVGSKSDLSYIESGLKLFKEFEIPFMLKISSAHRTPEETVKIIEEMESKGVKVFIAVAGYSAHLPGVVSAHTIKPVIGVPIPSSDLSGVDALHSIVQMPPGIPVATVTIGKAGFKNAVILAIEILAISDDNIREKLLNYREEMRKKVINDSKEYEKELKKSFNEIFRS